MITANFRMKNSSGFVELYEIEGEDIDDATGKLARIFDVGGWYPKLEWSRREGDEQVTSYNIQLIDADNKCIVLGTATIRVPKSDKPNTRRQLRILAGFLTQESLADHVKITRRTVVSWEKGKDVGNSVLLDLYLNALVKLQAFEMIEDRSK